MSLASAAVARPVLTTMATLIVVVVGAVSLFAVQTDLLPPIELTSLSVITAYAGATPEVIECLVTEEVESAVATVPGVEELQSSSSEGTSEVSLRFAWGTDLDTAALDVRAKLEDELNELPDDVTRPQVRKFDVASFPVVILGVSSPLDPVELTTLVEEQLRPRLSRVPGVAQVDMWGEFEREIRVELHPERLRAYAIGLETIAERVGEATLDLPTGSIEAADQELTLRAPSELRDLHELEETVVAVRDGASVRVRDVATVVDSYQRLERIVRVDGDLGLRLAIRKESDANTVAVAEAVIAEVARLREQFPQVRMVSVSNQGDFIQRSIDNVANSIFWGGGLALSVLFLFLGSIRSTLVIAIAIPISLIATFALIYLSGLTLNLMSLGGLALGVGMMVDNSIVVLDNIFRRKQELDEDARTAAIEGAREVSAAIFASTLTTLVIFLPIVFVGGISGQLFGELAYVVAFSLTASLLVALTVVPMLAARLLRGDAQRTRIERLVERVTGRALGTLQASYGRTLRSGLARPWGVVALSAASLAASVAIVPTLGSELFPPSDEGEVRVTADMPVGTRLELVEQQTRRLEALARPLVPDALATTTTVGASRWNPSAGSTGELQYLLPASGARSYSNEDVAARLRAEVADQVPGMRVRVRAPQGSFILQRILGGNGDGLSVEIYGADLERLDTIAAQVMQVASEVPGVTDVERDRESAAPEVDIRTDRDAAADLGLDAADVARALEIALAGRNVGDFRSGSSAYRILVQLADAPHRSLQEILDLPVANDSGELVPLSAVTRVEHASAPLVIARRAQRRVLRVTPHVEGRPTGTVARELETRLAELAVPAGYEVLVAGTWEEQERSDRELLFAFGLAILLVYMVLAAQYESLRDPWIVMLAVPMAATGVFVALALTGTTLNVQTYIGCIMLGGIVVNNSVLIVDQASQLRSAGMPLRAALLEAGRRRLRPILMTTSTTALALVPLALGIGEGADTQAPLARAVLGGLMASTVFTLVLVPAAYALLHRRDEPAEATPREAPAAT